jgi:chromosome segregation ATPase
MTSTKRAADGSQICCPVCTRDFNTKADADGIVVELKKYISKIPRKIADLDEKILKNNEQYESIVKLTPIKEIYDKLRNHELPQLRNQIDELKDVELKTLRNALRQNEYESRALDERKQLSDKLLNLILTISQYSKEINELDERINKMNSNIDTCFEKTLDEIQEERNDLQDKFSNINDKHEFKLKQLRSFEDKLCVMKEKLNSLNNERLTLGKVFNWVLIGCAEC